MKNIKLKIKNKQGHLLHAQLELPAVDEVTNYAVFAHCFTCSSTLNAVRNISKSLTAYGFGVVRFDFTGLGRSEGEFADSHFSANVDDLLAVYEYMSIHYTAPSLLVGHSLGGAAVLVAGAQLPQVKAVSTIGAPADVEHVKHLFIDQFEGQAVDTDVEVNIGGRSFIINQTFVEHFSKVDLPSIIRSLKKPLLIFHSPFDKTVGIENANKIYQSALHPKSFISLDQADHLLTNKADSIYVGNIIGSWVQRYFG